MVALQTRKKTRFGVVTDAVPCLRPAVICDLLIKVIGLPIEDGSMLAHPSVIRQSPGGVLQGLQKFMGDGWWWGEPSPASRSYLTIMTRPVGLASRTMSPFTTETPFTQSG